MNRDWRSRLFAELANASLFDEGVEVARNACVAGAPIAAAAIAAAAWYNNPLTGVPALRACMQRFQALPMRLRAWQTALRRRALSQTALRRRALSQTALRRRPPSQEDDSGYAPGFGFVSRAQARSVLRAFRRLVSAQGSPPERGRSSFFLDHAEAIGQWGGPLNQVGLTALQFLDHGSDPEEAERWYLLSRLEIAIVEAQAAQSRGLGEFPFFERDYAYEGKWPEERSFDIEDLRRRVGV